jgi:predicted nucleic acid-binding protein
MPKEYCLDTSIYIDYFEDRSDRLRPLGEWAHMLLSLIESDGDILVISDLLREELEKRIPKERIAELFESYGTAILEIEFTRKQFSEALIIARERDLPFKDVLYAIMARDNNAILVARDHHFEGLLDISIPRKPEEII